MKNAFQHVNEWNSLINTIGKLNSFIEIGTCKGGTFKSLSQQTTGKKISIDLATGGFGGIGLHASKERNIRISNTYKDTHFIEGDSNKIETVKTLSELLNGELVDFLFIDGDHSYKGVLTDYMLYRQFVKQNGYIAFHDIIDSEFHRNANCFVSTLWNKLKSNNGVEFISPDNTDVSDDAKHIGTNIFGGIGLIKNDFKESKFHIFQVIHNQESIDLCINAVENYIPTLMYNSDTIFFENNIIRKVFETYKFKKNDYIGITSPIMPKKTFLTIDKLIAYCGEGIDVLNYGSLKTIAGDNTNVWAANGNGRQGTNLYKAALELNDSKILVFDIFTKKWTCIYCNYFICKVSIFETYVSKILIPVMEWLKTSKWNVWNKTEVCLMHRNKWYPIAVFICEYMFGTFLSRKNYNVKDLRDKLNINGIVINA